MIAIIATFEVAPGKETEFEETFRALAEQVRSKESGNSLYTIARAKKSPQTYRVMELYADKDAIKLHGGTDYFTSAIEKLKTLVTAEPTIEMLDVVV
jgi:quinol monooxygenase YgiN